MKVWSLLLLATVFFACNQGSHQETNQDSTAEGSTLKPATPAGKVTVTFRDGAEDTGYINIHFELNGQTKDKEFDLPLAKDVAKEDLWREVWDKPNSCYIGVLKHNRTTRYYHASEDNGDLKINQVGTPPQEVWTYAETKLGLGKVTASGVKMTDHYEKKLQSGNLMETFIVKLVPASTKDSIRVYAEYGGANRTISVSVPKGASPGIEYNVAKPEQCFLTLAADGQMTNAVDISVDNGHLQISQLVR
jgi:hypothetical protein